MKWIDQYVNIPEVQAAAIALTGLFIAMIVWLFWTRVLTRLAGTTKTNADDLLVLHLRWPVTLTVTLIGFWYAGRAFGLVGHGDFVFQAVLQTFALGAWSMAGMRLATKMVHGLASETSRFPLVQPRTAPIFIFTLDVLVVGAAVYFFFLAWGINVSAWVASAGIVGIAVGFAAQDTLANLIGGLSIIADAPYRVGDFLTLEGGQSGRVVDIGLRSTRVLTPDQVEIVIPNSTFAAATVTNPTGGPTQTSRLRVPVGVAYDVDVDQVRSILIELAGVSETVLKSPAPVVRFLTMGDFSLGFELQVWLARPEDREPTLDGLNTAILKRFRLDGVTIPFPTQELNVRTLD